MAKLWQQIMKGEKGQVLPVVLILMALGGLLIAPSLSYASTSLNAGQIVEKKVRGVYAADAGIEDALWRLKNNPFASYPYSYELPENINQMAVAIETEKRVIYTLYYGELIVVDEQRQPHYDELTVDGEMVWDEPAGVYKYTITVTWQPKAGEEGTPEIKLTEVGVRLPIGYSYQPGSAASFFGGILFSTDEPDYYDIQDGAGAYMVGWRFEHPPRPAVTEEYPTGTQTFYVTGEGGQGGDYTWVEAVKGSIGQVGEVIGTLYRITATATRPEDDDPTATVMADAIVKETEEEAEAEIRIILWQINPQ